MVLLIVALPLSTQRVYHAAQTPSGLQLMVMPGQ
jgi:hypothetical protein